MPETSEDASTVELSDCTLLQPARCPDTWALTNDLGQMVVLAGDKESPDVAIVNWKTHTIHFGASPSFAALGRGIAEAIRLSQAAAKCRGTTDGCAAVKPDEINPTTDLITPVTTSEFTPPPPRKLERIGREPAKIIVGNLYGRESFAAYLKVSPDTFDRIRAAMGDRFPTTFKPQADPNSRRLVWEGKTLLAYADRLQTEALQFANARGEAPHA